MYNGSRYGARLFFASGIVVGMVICLVVLRVSSFSLISQQVLDEQSRLIADLREENRELTDDLFIYQGGNLAPDMAEWPYPDDDDASSTVAFARQQALDEGKFLMVTFGANWCVDCRALYRLMRSPEVQTFTSDIFDFVNVDVGKFNVNVDVASELGIDLQRGIPVAIFYDPEGEVIGTTNEGQLEPSRFYTSRQILKFVRDIVEKSSIAAPDSVQ